MMIALKTYQNGGSNTGSKHVGSPKTNPAVGRNHRQIPQPIKSWTSKPVRINGKPRENGIITSPRMLTGGLTGKATAVPVKQSVGGEWSLKECEVRYILYGLVCLCCLYACLLVCSFFVLFCFIFCFFHLCVHVCVFSVVEKLLGK